MATLTLVGSTMPLYVARLTNGNCAIALAADPQRARARVQELMVNGEAGIATMRELSSFAAYFALNDEGDLETLLWDNRTVGDIYENEYPLLKAAFLHANAELLHPIVPRPGWEKRLQATDKQNAVIILKGVRLERERLNPEKRASLERSIRTEERRTFPRWPADFQLLCETSAGIKTARGVELSEGGLVFTTEESYSVGTEMSLQCTLASGGPEPIAVKGVVRHTRASRVAVQYLNLRAADRLRIIGFVTGNTASGSA